MDHQMYPMEPNLVVEEYRNHTQYQMSRRLEKHLDFVEISKDGVVIIGTSNLCGRIWCGSVWVFNDVSKAPELEHSIAGVDFGSGVTDGKFLADSTKLIVVEDVGALQVFNLVEVADKKTFYFSSLGISYEHDEGITMIDLTNDKLKAISGSSDMCIKFWDIDSLTVDRSLSQAHSHIVTSVAAVPDSNVSFASTSLDGNALLWDIRNEKPALLISNDGAGFTASAWCDENVISLGSAAGSLTLIDVRTKGALDKQQPYQRPIHRLRYDKTVDNLAICADGTTVFVFQRDGDNLRQVYKDDRHTDFVRGLSWTPDGLYSCGWDQQVLQHTIPRK